MTKPKTATVSWAGQGLAFKGVGGSGYTIQFGDPAGPDAASPMEVVAMASAACTAMDVIDILRKKRQAVTSFEVKVVGLRQEEHPRKFTEIDLEYVVSGHNIDPKAVERAIELSLTKYCSVNQSFGEAVEIKNQYRIIETEPVAA
jgi:putative redox protein